jgi:integrase
MARRIKDTALDSRQARRKLTPRGEPYYRSVERGVHLGYRRRANAAGTWLLRSYRDGAYRADRLGIADDLSDADGATVLTYWQAVDAVRKRMAEQGRAVAESVRRLTVADAMDAYLRLIESEGRSPHTVRDARYRDRALIRPALGKLIIAELTTDRLRHWRDGLVKAPPRLRTKNGEKQKHRDMTGEDAIRARRASANRVWTVLRSALNHVFNDGKVASDHAWRKVKPFKKVDAARIRFLTVAEAKRLINACDPDLRRIVQAALYTGAHYSELTRLVVSDFNPDIGTISVRQSKSGHSRNIVLTAEGQAFFAELTVGRSGDEVMLPKADGTAWRTSHQLRPMAEAVKRAKIKPSISFHGLRHTWASLAVMNDMPLLVVAKNLGHSDTRMVERHYGHLAPSYIADAIRAGAPRFGFKANQKVASLGGRA